VSGLAVFGETILDDLSDTEVTKDPVNVGNALPTVPLNRFAIWSDYTMQGGPPKGVQIGGSVRYTGATKATPSEWKEQPCSTRWLPIITRTTAWH
jgi:outer membrane receptor for monomeric catechols